MASSSAKTVDAYLGSLPPERRAAITPVLELVRARLPRGFEETMQYGMISWVVPLAAYPGTYNGQPLAVASLAAQKAHSALYLMGVYASPGATRTLSMRFASAGKKLDMGKSCLRWKRVDELALDAIGDVIAEIGVADFIALCEAARPAAKKAPAKNAPAKKAPAKNAPAKKAPAKKAPAKKAPAKKR